VGLATEGGRSGADGSGSRRGGDLGSRDGGAFGAPPERSPRKRLGQTSTDSQGELFLGYHAEEFADLFKANPTLFLMVLDASGRALFTSQEAFHAGQGRVEQFKSRLSGTVSSLTRDKEGRPSRRRAR
jgi:hypothetical protein